MKDLQPINTQIKDGDPRKYNVIAGVLRDHPNTLGIWRKFGLLERKQGNSPETRVRKHGAPEHMLGGAVNIRALGGLLVDRGVLTPNTVLEAEEAILVHDAGKPFEFPFVKAVAEGASWEMVRPDLEKVDPTPNKALTQTLENQFASQLIPDPNLNSDIDKGRRIHIARAEVAGRVHKARLLNEGVSDHIISLQGSTEYASCPDIEAVVDDFDSLEGEERTHAIQKLIVHWADDGMKESIMRPIDERAEEVFKKPANVLLSQAYKDFNPGRETAEEIQVRVGRKVEKVLSGLLGLEDPSHLYTTVDRKLQEMIIQAS